MIKYGLDIKVATTIPGDDGWRPVMLNAVARRKFEGVEDLFAFKDSLERCNSNVPVRVVEVHDDDPTYSV